MCRRCVVTGRVQGVGFRWATRDRARELRLTGSVSNLDDGSVEVVFCGDEQAMDVFRDWLASGPSTAEVDSIECEEIDHISGPAAFDII